MRAIIHPSAVHGQMASPSSKSTMQRALALALLHNGSTEILHPGYSHDDLAALGIIESCGAEVIKGNDFIKIISQGKISADGEINPGESGLSLRMFAPILALGSSQLIITGRGSLLNRPVHFFEEVLPMLGVKVTSNNGYLPVKLQGPLQPKNITIDGSSSSQYLTGLLMAFAAGATKEFSIQVTNLTSRPYVGLTLDMMKYFGYNVSWQEGDTFKIVPGNSSNPLITYRNESDWSGAAFLLVAAALSGGALVTDLTFESRQADKAILGVLEQSGVHLNYQENSITVKDTRNLLPFTFDATHAPDLFPPLAALACYTTGRCEIHGVYRLLHKESNRAASLQDVFSKMGADIYIEDDCMVINGGKALQKASVHSHEDHRIAMAVAVAALRANGEIILDGAETVNKSFPEFWNVMKNAGALINIENNPL